MARNANRPPPSREPVEIELDGKRYRGTWHIRDDMLIVEYAGQSKPARPGPGPEALAPIILRELVEESIRRGL